MSNQILISSGAKLRDLDDVIIGTDGVLSSLAFNVANGVPKLDENGKILVSQLPNSVMEFKGVWNAATNTPTLANGTGNAGDVYLCNVAGTVDFGAGPIAFAVGDYAVYTGTVWARSSGATGTVTSVGLSRSGDALAITNSPITTSGTINIGFAGTNLQYINGAGNLVTFPTIAAEAQRLITEVYNETGATLAKGSIVYINGGHGNLPTVTKAIATGDPTSAQTYGIVQNDIGNNNNGFVVVTGSLGDLDTQDYLEGTQLYLSGTTAGAWTSTKPYAPVHLVYVAIVTRSHPTQGVVEVSIQNGYEMDELHNVAAQNPDNNDILQYKTSTSLWTKVAGTTSNIAEGSNLYFTNARARAAISLTTIGSTGAATYDNSTGVLNIPNYVDQYVGTVTSVGLSAPTGFSVSGSPVTSSGTLALSFASGYSLPTNVKQSNWDDAYTWVAAFPTQTGNAGKFLTTDGSTLSWATNPLGTVTSVAMSVPTGLSVAGSPITSSGTLAVTFAAGYSIPTNASQTNWDTAYTNRITSATSPLSISSNVISISQANTSTDGYLSSTDWNTFNGKQNALTNPVTGTGAGGYVAFWDTANSITGESNLFWDASNNRLGINIVPSYALHTYSNNNTTTASAVIRGEYYGAIISTDSILSTYYALSVTNGSGTAIIIAKADGKVGINGAASNSILTVHGTGLYEGNVQIDASSPLFITNAPSGATYSGGLSARINGTEKARFAWNSDKGIYIYDPANSGLNYINNADATKFRVTSTGDAVFGSGTTLSGGGAARWLTMDADSGSTYSGGIVYSIASSAKAYSYFESGYLNLQANATFGVRLRTNATTNALTIESDGAATFTENVTAYGYDSSNGYFRVNRSGVYYGGIGLSNWAFSGDSANDIAIIAKNQFKVGTNNSNPSFLIDTSGRVAINSTSTSYRLYVIGDSGTWASRIRNGNGTDYADVYSSYGNGQHGIAIDTTSNSSGYIFKAMAGTGGGGGGTIPVIYAQNDQKIGFGNSSPNRLMEVGNGTTSSIPSWARLVTSGTNETGLGVAMDNKLLYLFMNSGGTIKLDAYNYATSAGLPFQLGGNGGAVYVNTGAPISGGGALQVNGNVNINGVFQINGVTIGGGGGSGVTGTGTSGYHTKWTGSTTLGNGIIYDNGTAISLASNAPRALLDLGYQNDSSTASYIMFGGVNGPADNTGTGYGGGIVFKYYDTGGSYTKRSAGILQTAEGNYIRSGLAFFYNGSANQTTDWVEGMRLNDYGNLLINATSQAYPSSGYNFGMKGISSQAYIAIARSSQTLGTQGMVLGLDTSNAYLTVRDSINLILQTANTNRLTVRSNGNVAIGSDSDNGYLLQLNGSASFAYGYLSVYRGSSAPNDILVGNDGSRFYIGGNTYVAGSVTATGGFFDTSDARLKTLIEDNYLLSSIANVKAKLYKKNGVNELGYYAQDLLEILPSAVKEGVDGFLSLSYAQVHTAKIAVIEDEVTMLKNRVSELEKQLNLN